MQITANTTPFLAELFPSTDKHGRKHCVVVLKGSFDVNGDGECDVAAEQVPFVYADQHYGDPATTSIRFESDFAPVKPRRELLVNGSAFAPRGRPVTALEIALVGPGVCKRAAVTGDRIWVAGLLDTRPSAPEPFVTMPVVWDRAFGGADLSHTERPQKNGTETRNLVGVGFHLNSDQETVLGNPLPNVERPESPMRNWSDKPEPIGFGPIGRGWQPRVQFAGTYDQQWVEETRPFLPADFDEHYFQSAPFDQQLDDLSAGATFGCLNMSETGRFVARLPPFSCPVRFIFDDSVQGFTITPDTLVLQPSAGRVILLGRTSVPLPRKITALHEVQVGPPKRKSVPGKRHFRNLSEAVTALRRRRV
jgi:hypothetical protein